MGSSDPILVALAGAFLALIGNLVVSVVNNRNSIEQDKRKAQSDLDQEKLKAKYDLILASIATNDPEAAKRNIEFFIGSRLLDDAGRRDPRRADALQPGAAPASGARRPDAWRACRRTWPSSTSSQRTRRNGPGHWNDRVRRRLPAQPDRVPTFSRTINDFLKSSQVCVEGARNKPGEIGASATGHRRYPTGRWDCAEGPAAGLLRSPDRRGRDWTAAIRSRRSTDGVGILLINWGRREPVGRPGLCAASTTRCATAASRA